MFNQERLKLKPWELTPFKELQRKEAKCNWNEIAEIHVKLRCIQAERAITPEWDSDTQDDI